MSKIKISFIIPVYNSEKYLEKCLCSIFNQTNKNFEIVLVNDGSTDGSQRIIDKFMEKYPKCIKVCFQENQGISAARNRGIDMAEGEYIAFIDNDDLIDKNYVEKVSAVIKKTKSDMIIFGYDTMDEFERKLSIFPVAKDKKWARWGVCTVWLIVAKRELYIKNNIRFPVGLFNEDMPVSIKLSYAAKKVETLDEILYHYRVYKGNTSSKIHSKFEEAPDSRRNVFREFRNIVDKLEDEQAIWMIKYNAVKFYYGMLLVYFQNETKEVLLNEYEKFTLAIKEFFPDYKETKVYLFSPKGESLKKRIAVVISAFFDRLGMFKWFLLLINKKL